MDQHPVPQNISSYEFHLVGDMTLKQFFQLAGGGVVVLILYRTPFPAIIKWPLVFLAVLAGILLAFVPLQGRPFSQWILVFIKAVYSPTEFFWNPAPASSQPPADGSRQPSSNSPLDKLESQLVSKVSDLFATVTHRPTPAPTPSPVVKIAVQPVPLVVVASTTPPPSPTSSLTIDQLRAIASGTMSAPPPPPPVNPFSAPAILTPTIKHAPRAAIAPALAATAAILAPTVPNILAGIVTQGGEIPIEGAILEISEKASGLPVRALKSNKLGQFQIATPLPNGEYVITVDREGYLFDPVLIVTKEKIIPPIDIRAKAVV